MFLLDPRYLIIVGPAILLAIWAQYKVKSTFAKYSRVPAGSGLTGAEAAARMLGEAGLGSRVSIERNDGFLTDHYDPRSKVLRLSPDVYDGRSLASVGVACHEAGHAVQDAKAYAPLALRNAMVPTVGIGSNLAPLLIFLGLILGATRGMGFGLLIAEIGLVLFAAAVVFSLVTLPVEFNASSRAKQMLPRLGIIQGQQQQAGVAAVLDAAALTYIAAAITAIAHLLYYGLLIFGGGRRN